MWKIYLMNLDNKQMKIGKKNEVIAVDAMKTYKGCILNVGTSWR